MTDFAVSDEVRLHTLLIVISAIFYGWCRASKNISRVFMAGISSRQKVLQEPIKINTIRLRQCGQ
jgi:hypothetical protein